MKTRGQKRLESKLDEKLYNKCRQKVAREDFVYDVSVLLFIEFYQVVFPSAKEKYDNDNSIKFLGL